MKILSKTNKLIENRIKLLKNSSNIYKAKEIMGKL